jgi:Family of unknown function (DUF5681)
VTFKSGRSGNPHGRPQGTQNKRTAAFRKLVAENTLEIAKKVVENAKAGDPHATALFFNRIAPRDRFVAEPVDLPPAKDAVEAQAQIGVLVGMAGRGELDLDSLYGLSRALALAIDTRLAELEERLEEQEGREPDDG